MEYSNIMARTILIFALTGMGIILLSIRRELGVLFRRMYSNATITSGMKGPIVREYSGIIENLARNNHVPEYKVEELFANKKEKERVSVKSIESLLNQYYTVLGCKPKDSLVTVKQKYRRLLREFHPDILSGKGVSEESIKMAKDRTTLIIEAYNRIKRNHS
jgi:hypothetical protein